MSDEAWLVLRGVPPYLWAHAIKSERQIAGRSTACDIHVAHDTVSRQHAEFWRDGSELLVRDLGSSNGSLVNQVRISEASLQIGDFVQLGEVQLDVVPESAIKESTAIYEARPTAVVAPAANPDADESLKDLSAAQLRVLRLLLQGYSEKKAAAELYISPHTVHTHVKHIYRQLGVRSRGELMASFLSRTTSAPDG